MIGTFSSAHRPSSWNNEAHQKHPSSCSQTKYTGSCQNSPDSEYPSRSHKLTGTEHSGPLFPELEQILPEAFAARV